ncbi:MAG: tetratricopeptide repeat protein [Candidatus Neomarinimicrobiota bacterium]
MNSKKPITLITILLTGVFIYAGTRVAYTRPGLMMRIPTSSNKKTPYLFRAGVSTEFHNFNPFNTARGVYFETELGRGFSVGFSGVTPGDTTRLSKLEESTYSAPAEFGFHFQQRVYSYNDISVSVGLQDVVFQSDQTSEEMLSLNTSLLSAFLVLSSEKDLGEYKFNTYFGFGTGGLAPVDADTLPAVLGEDGKVIADSIETNAGVFIGFLMKTPYFSRRGGMDIVGEFDGTGVNVGLRIPLTSDYRLNLGFTHMEKLPEWGNRYWSGHPGFTIGFDMAVPRDPRMRVQGGPSGPTNIYATTKSAGPDGSIPIHRDSTVAMANVAVETLRDSMALMNNEMRNLLVRLNAMEQNSKFLSDSLSSLKLETNVSEKNMNEALRYLSRSLRYFYAGDYREALKEVDLALELNPDLALAYARRGSIYYKLGDVQRATINWNLALRLDPEYTDVRNILKALNENKLKSASIIKE